MNQFDDPDAIVMNGLRNHHPHPQSCVNFGPEGMGSFGMALMDDFPQPHSVESDSSIQDTGSDTYSP